MTDDENKNTIPDVDISKLLNSAISFKTIPTPIDTIINRMDTGYYLIPENQRKYVWDEKQVIALIISILKGIPIPQLYMYSNLIDGKYTIIDGQQRITSLYFFIKGIFPKPNDRRQYYDFKLITEALNKIEESLVEDKKENIKALETEFGLKFKTFKLSDQDFTYEMIESNMKNKLDFDNKALDFGLINVTSKSEDINGENSILPIYTDIFRLLNNAGTPLTNQEIRNGIYYLNPLYKALHRFHKENSDWHTCKIIKNNNEKNVEFLLRLLALDFFIKYDKNNKNELKNFIFTTYNPQEFISSDCQHLLTLRNHNAKYSDLIDKYSVEISDRKDIENFSKQEILKLEHFFSGIANKSEITKNTKPIKQLHQEAFFVAASKLDMLNINFKISNLVTDKLNSISSNTTSTKLILIRTLSAMKLLLENQNEQ